MTSRSLQPLSCDFPDQARDDVALGLLQLRILGPLGRKKLTVWAACLFADPIADIAVLGQPDDQELSEQAEAYNRLVEDMTVLAVANAPAQGFELLTGFRGRKIKNPTPGEGPACVLSLDGWAEGRLERRSNRLAFMPGNLFVGGMSGSPIISLAGEAIGVVSVAMLSPVLADALPAGLLRQINRRRYSCIGHTGGRPRAPWVSGVGDPGAVLFWAKRLNSWPSSIRRGRLLER